jgi:hypothetical protein
VEAGRSVRSFVCALDGKPSGFPGIDFKQPHLEPSGFFKLRGEFAIIPYLYTPPRSLRGMQSLTFIRDIETTIGLDATAVP